jgi:hypothetical protein
MPPSDIELPPIAGETTRAREPVRQLSVFLHNRVGALLSLVKLLNEHDIEVLGLSVQDSQELTLVRLIVTDPDGAKTVFESDGHSCASRPIVVVELKQGVHDLAHALSGLLAAEINIQYAYPLMVRPKSRPLLALHVDDYEIGEESLSKCGFKVLTQADLSR